jgi:hypothetical protein
MHAIAGSDSNSNVVDLYNSATLAWTTALLSVARSGLAATFVGNVAFFAGGYSGPSESALLCWVKKKALWERVSCVF